MVEDGSELSAPIIPKCIFVVPGVISLCLDFSCSTQILQKKITQKMKPAAATGDITVGVNSLLF
jgi:hypothetical protein